MDESNCLVNFYRFAGEVCNIKILHYHPMMMYYGVLGYVRNYKGLNFYEMMSQFVFDSIPKELLDQPNYTCDKNYLESLFKEKHLIKGRTILLAPYANSLHGIPIEFWENLVASLNKLGYTVCTNSSGCSELPIKGSIPIYIPYKALKDFLELAGYSISLRSGLCDIMSQIEHTKIIIHPDQDLYSIMGGLGSSFEYFSLNAMKMCDDALEYEVVSNDPKKRKRILTNILRHFGLRKQLVKKIKTEHSYCVAGK